MTPPGNWREKEAERGEVGGGVDGCDIRSHFDVALLLAAPRAVSSASVSSSNPCLGLETHGGDEVSCDGHFHVPSRCKIGVSAFLPLSVARPSPIPILVWKHDEPHFHVERTRTGERANKRSFGGPIWFRNWLLAFLHRRRRRRSPAVRSNFPSEHSHSTTTTTLNNEGCKGSGEMRDETTAWHGMHGPRTFLPSCPLPFPYPPPCVINPFPSKITTICSPPLLAFVILRNGFVISM